MFSPEVLLRRSPQRVATAPAKADFSDNINDIAALLGRLSEVASGQEMEPLVMASPCSRQSLLQNYSNRTPPATPPPNVLNSARPLYSRARGRRALGLGSPKRKSSDEADEDSDSDDGKDGGVPIPAASSSLSSSKSQASKGIPRISFAAASMSLIPLSPIREEYDAASRCSVASSIGARKSCGDRDRRDSLLPTAAASAAAAATGAAASMPTPATGSRQVATPTRVASAPYVSGSSNRNGLVNAAAATPTPGLVSTPRRSVTPPPPMTPLSALLAASEPRSARNGRRRGTPEPVVEDDPAKSVREGTAIPDTPRERPAPRDGRAESPSALRVGRAESPSIAACPSTAVENAGGGGGVPRSLSQAYCVTPRRKDGAGLEERTPPRRTESLAEKGSRERVLDSRLSRPDRSESRRRERQQQHHRHQEEERSGPAASVVDQGQRRPGDEPVRAAASASALAPASEPPVPAAATPQAVAASAAAVTTTPRRAKEALATSIAPSTPAVRPCKQAHSTGKPAKVVHVCGVPYTVLEVLGRGGSSKVYSVLSPSGEKLALKRVDTENSKQLEAFENEVALLQHLRHCEQVVHVVGAEVNRERGRITIVMEAGEADLNKYLHHIKKQTLEQIQRLWREMIEAVQVVHAERIVHSDLKPANFLMVNGRVKLIDFGIAKKISSDTTNIQRENSVGTLSYMAPEAVKQSKEGVKLGRASDVWALGIILYQMVYGRPPMAHMEAYEKMVFLCNPSLQIEFPPGHVLEHHCANTKANLMDVMRRCLQRDPRRRPSLQELLDHPFLQTTAVISREAVTTVISKLMQRISNSAGHSLDVAAGPPWEALCGEVWEDLIRESASQQGLERRPHLTELGRQRHDVSGG